MTTTAVGRQAEQAASAYLQRLGYSVLARNWRTRYCEIDIVARKTSCLYFVEVKYRASARQGAGLEYVTPVKLRRMRFAAMVWLRANQWRGDSVLAAIEVCAPDFAIGDFIESIALD